MENGSIRGSAVNVTKNPKQLFFWDAVTEADYPASRSIESSDEKKWNNNCNGSWKKEWKQREDIGDTRVLEKMQHMGKQNIDDSFISTRMEYLSEFDLVG